ncbi:MAG: Tol-Pal system protein TolB [Rickettsiales bacterium]|nr:MAG: Tol-Pal system protein TolB [Rickettsiales bacterium]
MKKYLLIILICFQPIISFADNVINITNGIIDPVPVAINGFAVMNEEDTQVAKEIIDVITNDLKNCGIFRPISPAAFIETKKGTGYVPLFAAWQQINALLLLNGDVVRTESGKINIKFTLWDSILERPIVTESLELPEKLWRRAAHKISDRVYEMVTGSKGYFNTRITYVAESGPYLKRIKRIAIMDQDGANHHYLTSGADLVLTPRFSHDGKHIIYLSYKNKIPQVFTLDLRTGRSRLLGNFPGMSFAPRFSPDGQYAIMSIAKNGFTNIYEMNLKTKRVQQLTEGKSINTSPTYSPDGKNIVFNSDRNGGRHIYTMDRLGNNIQKISTGNGVYAEPSWSNSNYIAFTKISRTVGFAIGIMNPELIDGQNSERLIAKGYLVESPSWSCNGRMIVFTKGSAPNRGKLPKAQNIKGLNKLHVVDFTGYSERIIPTPEDASDPDWSQPID